jgi:hypothetical protein
MDSNEYSLEAFINRLLEEKQFANLDADVRSQLHNDLLGRAEDYINASLIAALNDTEQQEFSKLLDEDKSTEELQEFLKKHINDPEEVVAAALLRFRDAYLGK